MPNAKVLETKKAEVERLAEAMKNAPSGVLFAYQGITVAADTKLRTDLRKAGVDYRVIKNTIISRAAAKVGMEALEPVLKGTTAMAIASEDMVAPAKILVEFAQKNNNKFKIKAGFIEGKVVDAKDVSVLAELPPREMLIARVLAGFNSPITGLVNVLNGNIRGLCVALNAIAEQKGA